MQEGERLVKKLMLPTAPDGCYVYLFDSVEDVPGYADLWFATPAEAKACARAEYGVPHGQWTEFDDPLPGCINTTIAPVRVSGVDRGTHPPAVHFERLEGGTRALWAPPK